ncbi:hypothetical protein [Gynuella sp.]|uniref:hypothetical protein n=1 Tax=Gynuella sp. TaxID=2969146 RepID=UPI003D150756
MDIDQIIAETPEENVKSALSYMLKSYMNPAFGALPKNEVELIVLNVLESLNIIDPEPELYQLVSKLRITRSKARGLIYDRELRRSTESDLDERVKTLLKRPLIQKNGDLYVLEVENPLISDHLRSKVQKLGYVSDGSFSPSLIKLGLDAISALIESYLSDQDKKQLTAILIEAGAPDTSFGGVIKATLKKVAVKVASDSGEVLMDKASELITPIIDAGFDLLRERVSDLFDQDND